jgi:hypothetical protein
LSIHAHTNGRTKYLNSLFKSIGFEKKIRSMPFITRLLRFEMLCDHLNNVSLRCTVVYPKNVLEMLLNSGSPLEKGTRAPIDGQAWKLMLSYEPSFCNYHVTIERF